MTMDQVRLISHADWSIDPKKRWLSIAIQGTNQLWKIYPPQQADNPSVLFAELKTQFLQPGCILAGFDFPIGVPQAYALKAGITDFYTFLMHLGSGSWNHFYEPAEIPSQISLFRPFYPLKPGNARRIHLEHALGMPFSQLFRLCDLGNQNRRPACPLFWTLGSQQVGKAALSGWKLLLVPGLGNLGLNLKIWPFAGPLDQLCTVGSIVAVESYPAEFYAHLGISFSRKNKMSKRRHADRISLAEMLYSWVASNLVDLDPALSALIFDGFGADLQGEDRFDAFVGLCGMLNIVLGQHPSGEPLEPPISTIEGWIFGQELAHPVSSLPR